jgi:hypothetical protein
MRHLLTAGILVAALAIGDTPAIAAKAPDARTGFIKSCVTQMYYSEAVCGCMADKAATAIGPEGIAYLSLQALDVTHSAAMSKQMSVSERNKIDNFMKNAPHQCEGAK